MTSSKVLFDTNVLLYNQNRNSLFYSAAFNYHKKVFDGEIKAVISSQNILEFTSVLMNPKITPHPLTKKQVITELENYYKYGSFEIIYPNEETLVIFIELLKKYHLRNHRQIFDIFLVATMLSNGINTILTANDQDFPFKEIKVIELS